MRWAQLVAAVFFVSLVVGWIIAWRQVNGLVASQSSANGYSPLPRVSQSMQDATVAMEDHAFYQHHGFDWAGIRHAAQVNWDTFSIKEGGSTITQQLAKNLFLTKDRTLWRKAQEVPLTCEMEWQLTKKQILELYLNNIDYGMGQRGIGAAARYYFHKTPAQLTLAESACLVGMVPSPPQVEVQEGNVADGEQTALSRMAFFFPKSYSQADIDRAQAIPLDRLMYPFRDALDRGATDEIPAVWHGVSFYFYASPDETMTISQVSTSLKPQLASFLDAARKQYGLTGIDHLGVYNDRPVRGSQTVISAHAYGQAIDISGFRFADGSRIKVEDHENPQVAARLAPLEALLKHHFDIVVDWRDDPKRHQTHFHCEVRGPRPVWSGVLAAPAAAMK